MTGIARCTSPLIMELMRCNPANQVYLQCQVQQIQVCAYLLIDIWLTDFHLYTHVFGATNIYHFKKFIVAIKSVRLVCRQNRMVDKLFKYYKYYI